MMPISLHLQCLFWAGVMLVTGQLYMEYSCYICRHRRPLLRLSRYQLFLTETEVLRASPRDSWIVRNVRAAGTFSTIPLPKGDPD